MSIVGDFPPPPQKKEHAPKSNRRNSRRSPLLKTKVSTSGVLTCDQGSFASTAAMPSISRLITLRAHPTREARHCHSVLTPYPRPSSGCLLETCQSFDQLVRFYLHPVPINGSSDVCPTVDQRRQTLYPRINVRTVALFYEIRDVLTCFG